MVFSSPFTLNPSHRPSAYRAVFEGSGRLHIPNILTAESSRALYQTLQSTSDWTRSIHLREGEDLDILVSELDEMPTRERVELEQSLAQASTDSLQYIFDTVRVSANLEARRIVPANLMAVHQFINCAPFLDFMRQVSGVEGLAFADVMATRYLPGHFLTAHGDENPAQRRRLAYVLSMTPVWRADWGGILMFLDDDGHVAEGYVPMFNALNIFSVPQTHAVSLVTRLAKAPRLSVTGWIHESD